MDEESKKKKELEEKLKKEEEELKAKYKRLEPQPRSVEFIQEFIKKLNLDDVIRFMENEFV